MTYLTPCRQCHRRKTGCEKMEAAKQAARAGGLSSAKVKCYIPRADFPPGSTVDVATFEITTRDIPPDDCETTRRDVIRRGVVAGWFKNKATVILDPGQEIVVREFGGERRISYLKARPDRLTRIDIPIAPLCECSLTRARCKAKQHPYSRNGEWICEKVIRQEGGND